MIDPHTYPGEVRGVAVPSGRADLLLPNAAVAEVITYQEPAPYPGAPPWLLGSVAWHERRVPVVSLAAADGVPAPETRGARARVVVCFTPNGNQRLPYVGILAVAPPRLARFVERELEPDAPVENQFVEHALLFAGQPAWIPDLDAVENGVLDALAGET